MLQASIFGQLDDGQFYCYVTFHPSTKRPIYVGKGKGTRYRPRGHESNVRFNNLLQKYSGVRIYTDVFPCCSEKEALQWEQELIHMFLSAGEDLYNMTSGGENSTPTLEVKLVCKEAAFRGHASRSAEDEQIRRELVRERLKQYNALLSAEEKDLLKAKNKAGHAKRTLEQVASSVAKVQSAKNSRTEEQKRAESETRSATLRLRHAEKTPEQKATTSRRRSESLQNRSPEEEALRGQRISAAKKLRNSLISDDEKLQRAQKIAAGMLKKSPEERRASALKAWATKKAKESQDP